MAILAHQVEHQMPTAVSADRLASVDPLTLMASQHNSPGEGGGAPVFGVDWAAHPVIAQTPDGLRTILDGHHRVDDAIVQGKIHITVWLFRVAGRKSNKLAKAKHKHFRKLKRLPVDTAFNRKAKAKIEKQVRAVLYAMAPKVAAQVRRHLDKVTKANDEDDLDWVDDIDLSGLSMLATGQTLDSLTDVSQNTGRNALLAIGVGSRGDLVNQVNHRAEDFATERAAELVGMKYDEDGNLVFNPDAEYSIDGYTRDELRSVISQGMQDGIGLDGIADSIEDLRDVDGMSPFSAYRASMIARTETANAHNQGALFGYQAARDAGVNVMKQWITADDPCDDCADNEDQGPIDLDDDFDSGDDAPPAHPQCECDIVGAVGEDDDGGDDEGDAGDDADSDTDEGDEEDDS